MRQLSNLDSSTVEMLDNLSIDGTITEAERKQVIRSMLGLSYDSNRESEDSADDED